MDGMAARERIERVRDLLAHVPRKRGGATRRTSAAKPRVEGRSLGDLESEVRQLARARRSPPSRGAPPPAA
jgi:hypothetical protein